jgi:hypothetical protein
MTKNELRSIRSLVFEIESKKRQREELYYRVAGSGIPIKTTWVQESAPGDKMAAVMSEVADLDESIRHDIEILVRKQRKAKDELARLSRPELVAIMTDYYMNGYTWERTAYLNGFSVQHVYRLHGEALKEIC